jgi:hypothetical protein
MGLGKRQFRLVRLRTFLKDQRAAKPQLRIELEARASRRVCNSFRIAEREIECVDRFDEGQTLDGPVG